MSITAEQILTAVKAVYNEDKVAEMVDEAITDFVDHDTVVDDFEGDEFECYQETGRGQAEEQVIDYILIPYKDSADDIVIADAYNLIKGYFSL